MATFHPNERTPSRELFQHFRPPYTSLKCLTNATTVTDLERPWRSFPCCRPFQVQSVEHLCSILPDFNWQRDRASPQRQLGFLSSSVKLHGRTTVSEKLLALGFAATMRLLSNYLDLLYQITSISCFLVLFLSTVRVNYSVPAFLSYRGNKTCRARKNVCRPGRPTLRRELYIEMPYDYKFNTLQPVSYTHLTLPTKRIV